jgi:hypothetical protein
MLSFEEKIMALATIRALGLSGAVCVVAKLKKYPPPAIREELDQLDSTHYLLDNGFVQKTNTGVVQYVEFGCPQQPHVITKEFFERCKATKQAALLEALMVLGCTERIGRSHKPSPIVKKVKHAQVEESVAL